MEPTRREDSPGHRLFEATDRFADRHIGPREHEIREMLEYLGFGSLDELSAAVVPEEIRITRPLRLARPLSEHEMLAEARELSRRNRIFRTYIGIGYHGCITPPVILRNVMENPGWYTQYTPYQAEIAQGRLEALLNFQTMVAELTALPLANASLLDEATAAAEAMSMCWAIGRRSRSVFWVDDACHPQTIEVIRGRAEPLGIEVREAPVGEIDLDSRELCGMLLQYPDTHGRVRDHEKLCARAAEVETRVVVATDLLGLTLLRPPGEFGADIAVGSAQRFGVPLGLGGPHAAFLATREAYKRHVPGRIVGVSRDESERPAYRLAMQTREQHIRRDKATSNICTSQVLLAIMASMYAVYHGPAGLRGIARRVHALAAALAAGLKRMGYEVGDEPFFDTLRVVMDRGAREDLLARAREMHVNLRDDQPDSVGIALDETVSEDDLRQLLSLFANDAPDGQLPFDLARLADGLDLPFAAPFARTSDFMTHDVFRRYHAEHEMLRYLGRLQARDVSLAQSMIPLGSCTMKLNGTTLMMPVTWPEFANLHPFAPREQWQGYQALIDDLGVALAEITGHGAVSFQPNAGAQGEYTGLLVIRAFHDGRNESRRDVCLIPSSAHGTNPASAVMAGFRVVVVDCTTSGDIDLGDLQAKIDQHRDRLGALMVTYPSTHGVFEDGIVDVCRMVHEAGGQVYMDGANMNAQVGLCRPADMGADIVHLNLHKTFCIPHGGGGPGMGPIAVADHLAPFLPGHPRVAGVGGDQAIRSVSAAPYGSPSILPISWAYVRMMGEPGLRRASQVAILAANYMARRLESHYPVLFRGQSGLVAHEFILDTRPFRDSAGVSYDDIAKRLMDFGYHAPTVSWPVTGTLMVEPTESESREELDRYCDAMIAIREEIREIEEGRIDRENNPLRRAPHTAEAVLSDTWDRPYSRERAVYPAPWVRGRKVWPASGRIDNAHGDRHLVCTCGTVEEFAD